MANAADARAVQEEAPDRFHASFLWLLAGLLVAGLWLPPLASSLWVDETGTWWVISGTAHQVVERAETVQGQSPFYYLLLWGWVHIFGNSEVSMRLPSLLCCALSAWLIYLVARRLFDREVGRISVVAFVVWAQVVFEASNARPYALGILLEVAAAWLLIDWLDHGGIRRGIAFGAVAAMLPYVHPFLALLYIPLGIYAAGRSRGGSSAVSGRRLLAAAIGITIVASPIAVQLAGLARRREELSTPQTVSLPLVLTMLVPTAVVATSICILAIASMGAMRFRSRDVSPATRYLLLSWFVIPSGVLVAIAASTSLQLLQPRYFAMIAPAGAIICAYLLRCIGGPALRRMIVIALVILSVVDVVATSKMGDMRGAFALVRSRADPGTMTLLTFGFRESLHPSFYDDPARSSFLTAPALYYPVPGRVVAMPIDSPWLADGTARQRVLTALASKHVFAIAEIGSAYQPWLEDFFRRHGYASSVVGTAAPYIVMEFTKN